MKYKIELKTLIFFILMVFLNSCSDPLYFKKIKTKQFEVKWYYFSHFSSDSPYFVDVSNGKSNVTICKSYNIIDVNIINEDSILISFNEKPMLRGEVPLLLDSIFGMKVIYDTTEFIKYKKMKTFK